MEATKRSTLQGCIVEKPQVHNICGDTLVVTEFMET